MPARSAGDAILQNSAFRKIVKVDTHWQEAILDPDGNEDEQLTVMCANDQWVIIPGYHGRRSAV
jgi:hypothetical protein